MLQQRNVLKPKFVCKLMCVELHQVKIDGLRIRICQISAF